MLRVMERAVGAPNPENGDPFFPRQAERAVVGEEVVKDARDLEAGGVYGFAIGVEGGDGELTFEQVGDFFEVRGAQFEGGVLTEVRDLSVTSAGRPPGSSVRLIEVPLMTPDGSSSSPPSGAETSW